MGHVGDVGMQRNSPGECEFERSDSEWAADRYVGKGLPLAGPGQR